MRGFALSFIMGVTLVAQDARAEDYALVLSNRDYSYLDDARDAADFDMVEKTLRTAGFTVLGGAQWPIDTMRDEAIALQEALIDGRADRVVVLVSGHLVSDQADSWLLGRRARVPQSITVGGDGLSLSALAAMLVQRGAQAVMMVAPSDEEIELGSGVEPARPIAAPQGVAMFWGTAEDLTEMLRKQVLRPGLSYADLAKTAPEGVKVYGFTSSKLGFTPAASSEPSSDGPSSGWSQDMAYWMASRDIGTVAALEAYQKRFPNGQFREEADRLITELRDAPRREAEAIEKALNLSRNQRREVQRDLTMLGYDTRGVDGIFGRGTRGAIGAYQRDVGFDDTGFLTRPQLDELTVRAQKRADEIAEEQRRRREQQEREDRAYWRQTGADGTEDSLRLYLRRYPDGLFADTAEARLDDYEQERRAEAEAQDRAAWDVAVTADTREAYLTYLDAYPNGGFAETAKDRIAAIDNEGVSQQQIAQDMAEEKVVAGIGVTRLLIEQRLAQLGFEPGKVDGGFDKRTRRAIRRFQKATDLPATGHVSQVTMVRLLAASR